MKREDTNSLVIKSKGNDVIATPQWIAEDMVEMIPEELMVHTTKFIDIASKTGVFLVKLRNRLMKSADLIELYPNTEDRVQYIVDNQLYGICYDEVCLLDTRCNVNGVAYEEGNIIFESNLINLLKTESGVKKIKEHLKEKFGTMKFDVVIGNPPYQFKSTSIYPKFIDMAMDISDRVCMITKNNWLASKTIEPTRLRMMEAGITRIINYPKYFEIFENASVSVSIFNIDKTRKGFTHYTEIYDGEVISDYTADITQDTIIYRHKLAKSIADKCKSKESFSKWCLSVGYFNVDTNGKIMNDRENYIDDYEDCTPEHDVAVWYKDGQTPYCRYTNIDNVPRGSEYIDTYKVGGGKVFSDSNTCITGITLINTHSIASKAYCVLYCSTDKVKVYNASLYIKTQLFRFLTRLTVDGTMVTVTGDRLILVPDQDFTLNSDIDWSKSIAEIDKQLYKKYKLTPDEIEHIEKTTKAYEK